jgi:Phage tail tube protein, TTP
MTSRLVNGAKFAISATLAAASPITAITNAANAVASAAALPAVDSIVVLASGWPLLNGKVAKVTVSGGGSFTLGGVNTTSVADYPAGEGVPASYQIASAFVSLSKIANVEKSGGEQNYVDRQYVEDATGTQVRFPTYRSAYGFEIRMDYDPSLPWFAALQAADAAKSTVVLRETLPGGDVILYTGLIAFDDVPTKSINEVMEVVATFSLTSRPIRYSA